MEVKRNFEALRANGDYFTVVVPIIDSANRPYLKTGLITDSFVMNQSFYRLGTTNAWVTTGLDMDLTELSTQAGMYEIKVYVDDIAIFLECDKTKPISIYLKASAGVDADPQVIEVFHDINAGTTVSLSFLANLLSLIMTDLTEVHSYAALNLDFDTGTNIRTFFDKNGDALFRVQTDESQPVKTRRRLS